jgi:Family of unknown function (DUF6527)
MDGKRIKLVDHDQIYPRESGEYMGPDREHIVWFIPPIENGKLCRIKQGPWLFKEEEDGSLTITPSMNVKDKWHGFLTKGKWINI